MSLQPNINASRIDGDMSLSGTINASVFLSAGTSLYSIFGTGGGTQTLVQPGLNTYTGGTSNAPTINISAATLVRLSGGTISGGTIYSGSTNLYSIFQTIGSGGATPTTIQNGFNTYTGGTSTSPTINISAATLVALSGGTVSGGTIYSGSTNLYSIFQRPELTVNNVNAGSNIVTGGTSISPTLSLVSSPSLNALTLSGIGQFASVTSTGLSATTISANTIFSGTTNLSNTIISIANATNDFTRVQPGSNIATGGTANAPSISIVASPSLNALTLSGAGQFAGVTSTGLSATTVSANTIFSGSTNLSNTIITIANAAAIANEDITRIQAGSNIVTGGTANAPSISVVASPSLNGLTLSGVGQFAGVTSTGLSATTISGGTIYSGSTPLQTIIQNLTSGGASTFVQPGFNTYTGGTSSAPTVNISAATLVTISGGTVSGGTFYSGSTPLQNIIQNLASGGASTFVQNGFNTYTGGTLTNPTVNISAATLVTLSGGTVSGGTFFSGSTPLQTIIQNLSSGGGTTTLIQPGFNTYTGGTSSAPTINISAATLVTLSGGSVSGGTLFSGATNLNNVFATKTHNHSGGIGLSIDNGSNVILSGIKGYVTVPFSGRIVSYDIFSNVSGQTAIEVWKTTYASFPPTQANSITGSEPIVLTGGNKNTNSTLTTWTKDFNVGDIFGFNVISATTVNRVNIVIRVIKYN